MHIDLWQEQEISLLSAVSTHPASYPMEPGAFPLCVCVGGGPWIRPYTPNCCTGQEYVDL
jgi:hypothetical protein